MDAVLGELPEGRTGSGTAVTMTFRQVGGALGVALLGSVSSAAYTEKLDISGLPAPVASAARDSVASAVAVAGRLADPALLASARGAYAHAMTVVLLVCAAIAVLAGVLTAMYLPARRTNAEVPGESTHELARIA